MNDPTDKLEAMPPSELAEELEEWRGISTP